MHCRLIDFPKLFALSSTSWLLAGVLVLCALSCSNTDRSAPALLPPPLRVGSDLSNPPFGEYPKGEAPRGFEVDLCREIAALLGRPLHYEVVAFDQLLDALEQGRIDVACATLGITPERQQRVAFTDPYYRTSIAVVTRIDTEFDSLQALAGLPVHAGRGTTSQRALTHNIPDAQPHYGEKGESARQFLDRGEVTAVVMDAPDAFEWVAQHPSRYRILERHLAQENYAMALSLNNATLLTQINAALSQLRADGTLQRLLRQHHLESEQASPR